MALFVGQVVMDPVAVSRFLRASDGPVLRNLLVLGNQVKSGGRAQVGVHRPMPGERRVRAPGTLRDSIVVRVVTAGPNPAVRVGSDDPAARVHHEGTPPHVIRARIKPLLVFFWEKAGQVVAFPQVNHPGTKPNHYLTDPLDRLTLR